MAKAKNEIAVLGIRGFPGVQGGAETHCRQLYTHMTGWKFRVYRRKSYLTEQSQETYDEIEFIDWPSTRIQGLEAAWHTMRAVWHCALHRPTLVHVHNMGPAAIALPLRLLGIPIVMTYHSVNYEHSKWGRLTRWVLRQSERLSLRYCDRVIFVNQFRMSHFGAKIRDKSVYIPNGVEVAQTTPKIDFLQAHGIIPGEYVLAVGRITPEKGLEYLIQAAKQSKVVKQVVIVGEPQHGDSYLKQLQHLGSGGKIIFVGYATGNHLQQLYSHARLMALPSLSEGFPMALLEAMSYGLPIVASDLDATRQVGLPDTSFFAAGDTASLQTVLERQWINPVHRTNYDLSSYDWQTIAARTQQVFRHVISCF